MDSKEIKILHVIDNSGNHITVDTDTLKDNSQSAKYTFDLEWYLNHGYKKFDDIVNNIENGII